MNTTRQLMALRLVLKAHEMAMITAIPTSPRSNPVKENPAPSGTATSLMVAADCAIRPEVLKIARSDSAMNFFIEVVVE